PPFDADALMANVGGDRRMLTEVVRLCRDMDAPRLFKDLATGLANGNATDVAKAAHGLKGMVGAFNANEAWTAAKRLETLGREGKTEELEPGAKALVAAVQRLRCSPRQCGAV